MKMTNKQPKIYRERRESACSGIVKDRFIIDILYNCIISAYNRIVRDRYVLNVWYNKHRNIVKVIVLKPGPV